MLARLCVSDHAAATWADAAGPWLRAHGANWRVGRAILAPNAAWLAALKARAVEEALPVLGVEWLTPGRMRAKALGKLPGPPGPVALREDLHLLLELAAVQLPNNPLARAYRSDPAPFQEILDALEGAGWSPAVLPDADARELAMLAAKLRKKTGWLTTAAADQVIYTAKVAGSLPELGKNLLAVGFSPGDWALRPLLEAACAAYQESELVLDVVDYEQTAAAAWVGVWEEKFGNVAEWLEAHEAAAPFAPIALEVVNPVRTSIGLAKTKPSLEVLPQLWLADNLQAEADLVVAQALAFLNESGEQNPRVGIVVGQINSPLAREVAARLTELGLPHHNAPGHLPGRGLAQTRFETWLDWQENGRLAALVAWLRVAASSDLVSERVEVIERSLRDAAAATLSDDPAVLAAWLQAVRGKNDSAAIFLGEWPHLPEVARWRDIFQTILAAAKKVGWPESPENLEKRAENLSKALEGDTPRSAILRWVRAVTRVPGRTRDMLGREPWATLQITDAVSAAAQTWTHLILGGLQHGEWPADEHDSPLLDEVEMGRLNRQVLHQGPQGEGHWTAAPGHGLLLLQNDRRRLDRAGFARLLALPTKGLALAARLNDPADGRPARLSEYFWAVAKAVLGRLPSTEDWAALAAIGQIRREEFLRINFPKNIQTLTGEGSAILETAATQRAYRVRRDTGKKFDEFSFGLKTPPTEPLRLSCKNWQEAVLRPAAAWFEHLLKLRPRWDPATEDFAALSRGTWAHEWARPGPQQNDRDAVRESLPLPGLELWRQMAASRAEELRAQVTTAFAAAGRPLPQSWLDVWATAGQLTERWIDALAGLNGWPQSLAEISLPPALRVKLPGSGIEIILSGRMDLVLFPRPVLFAPTRLNGGTAWIFDFKAGRDAELSMRKLSEGEGLQLALYGCALQAMGAEGVSLTLLNRQADAEGQLTNADLAAPDLAPLWQLLADFAVTGTWGDYRDLTDKYDRPGEYPAATLPVPAEILFKKWRLTHPVFEL